MMDKEQAEVEMVLMVMMVMMLIMVIMMIWPPDDGQGAGWGGGKDDRR